MSPIAFADFTVEVLTVYSNPRYSKHTYGRMKMVLGQLAKLGAATTADLTTALMVRYVASLTTTNPNTINGYLSALAAACTLAIEERWLDRPPVWRRVRQRERPMVKNLPPTFGQVEALVGSLKDRTDWEGQRLNALAWLASLTGPRLREMLYAHVPDVCLEQGREAFTVNPLRQPSERVKTRGSARTVPLADALVPIVRDWIPRTGTVWLFPGVKRLGPWDGGSHSSRALGQLQAAAARVGIPHITWHALRHAFGTFAVTRWGVPVWVVQQAMGHTDIRTTQRYLHLADAPEVRERLRGVGFGTRG